MERAEIAELFYAALIGGNDVEQLFRSFPLGSSGFFRQPIRKRWARNPPRMPLNSRGGRASDNKRFAFGTTLTRFLEISPGVLAVVT